MKFSKLFVVLLVGLFTSINSNAQESPNTVEESVADVTKKESEKNAITLYLGAPSLGIGYARKLSDQFAIRGKVCFFKIPLDKNNTELGGKKVDIKGGFDFNTIDLVVDYTPFKKSSLKLVGGLSYLTKAKFEGTIYPDNTTPKKYGDIVLSDEAIGNIRAGGKWTGIAPYLAMGFGRAVPKNKVGFGFEIGGYFVGKSDVIFESTGMLTPTKESEEQDFRDWMNKITVIPNIAFHVNYKF